MVIIALSLFCILFVCLFVFLSCFDPLRGESEKLSKMTSEGVVFVGGESIKPLRHQPRRHRVHGSPSSSRLRPVSGPSTSDAVYGGRGDTPSGSGPRAFIESIIYMYLAPQNRIKTLSACQTIPENDLNLGKFDFSRMPSEQLFLLIGSI